MAAELMTKTINVGSKDLNVKMPNGETRFVFERTAVEGGDFAAFRVGDDLVIKYVDGTTVTVDGFYAEAAGASEAVIGEKVVSSVNGMVEISAADGAQLVAYSGERDSLLAALSDSPELAEAMQNPWMANISGAFNNIGIQGLGSGPINRLEIALVA